MKAIAAATLLLVVPCVGWAACVGTGSYRTCSDNQGNSYSVQRYGSTTYLQGHNSNTGSSWNQSSQRIGNGTYHSGRDAQGNAWSGTSQQIGNTTFNSGYDSDGNSYSGTTQRIGNSTYSSGYDSDGNYSSRTCSQFGCDDD